MVGRALMVGVELVVELGPSRVVRIVGDVRL